MVLLRSGSFGEPKMVILWHHCETMSFGTFIFLKNIWCHLFSAKKKKKKVHAAHFHTTTVYSDLVHEVAKSTYDSFVLKNWQ